MKRWQPALFAASLAVQAQAPAEVEARLRRDVTFLAAPELKGRGNGYPELDTAAARIQGELRELGLEARIQRFPYVAKVVRERQEALLIQAGGSRAQVWGKDLEALGLSGDADFRDRPLVFLGYGLQLPGGYDDLAGHDLKDRVVVLARTVPELDVFAHLPRGERSLLARLQKLQAAQVAGVLVLEDGLRPLRREEGPVNLGLPVLGVTAEALGGALGDLAARFKGIQETGAPDRGASPSVTFTLALKLRREEVQLPNVVTVIPGSDPLLSKDYIALGAHLDHLGLGERHSLGGPQALGLVHAGADDNASGTALVVELARELVKARPKRSILLLNFAGEEEGLLGSQYWVQHPTLPLAAVKFMINFDMVGRLDPAAPKLMVGALGAPKAALEAERALVPEGLALSFDTGASIGGSDHMSFSQVKIPTFFFFTGIHGDYHRPTDTADRINFPGMVKVAGFARAVALDLANGATVPVFDPETAKLPAGGEGGPMRIAFGTLPDYADNPKGFRINGVARSSTAEALGLQAGDILVRFGDKPLKSIYDFMAALGAHKPGDKVEIQWLRGDQLLKAEATLKGR